MSLIWRGSGSQLQKQYVGQAAEEIGRLSKWCQANPYWFHVMLIDEIDSAFSAGKQQQQENHGIQVAAALQSIIGDLNPNLFILSTTNFKHNIPEPLVRKGRIGYHYFVGPLSSGSRQAIIEQRIKLYNCEIESSLVQQLIPLTINFGGAFILDLLGEFENAIVDKGEMHNGLYYTDI
jgi:SpoVK/Ycf46/Vps4 family AAA+-type ATPase